MGAEHTAERELSPGIVEGLGQPKRWVGKVQRTVGAVDQVVGTVETLALILVGQHRHLAPWFNTDDPPVTVLANGQPPFPVEGQAVGSRLVVFTNVESAVAAIGPGDIHRSIRRPTIDGVGIG